MQNQLAKVVRGLKQAEARVEQLAKNTSEERWAARSDPSRWSVAECVAHLNLTSAGYIPRMRQAMVEARKLGAVDGEAKYRRDFAGWMFSVMAGPLPSVAGKRIGRVKTMAAFVPAGNLSRQTILADFKRDHDQLVEMAQADGLPLDKVWIRSPFGGRIRYNCYSAFVIVPRHDARHLDQAELVWNGEDT
ncbi:MAG: DinB family protein [Gemmatimonadaceae bacterium]|nr:DinB family protein [Gemmatimonadaceae bacterium]MDQ3243158.1 DinB family protein [Gemmatimonadota bacterium]